jgi:hypothetical protein
MLGRLILTIKRKVVLAPESPGDSHCIMCVHITALVYIDLDTNHIYYDNIFLKQTNKN